VALSGRLAQSFEQAPRVPPYTAGLFAGTAVERHLQVMTSSKADDLQTPESPPIRDGSSAL
jgi:hypothetical protein